MTPEIYGSSEGPHDLLTGSRDLVRRVHRDQRSTWFPLILFSFLTFLAIPAERISHRVLGACGTFSTPRLSGNLCRVYSTSGLIYWPIALIAAYAAISTLYSRRSRARGVETRVEMYVAVGVVLAVLLTSVSLLLAHLSVGEHIIFGIHVQEQSLGIFYRLISPACSIGLALLLLARLERNRVLLFADLLYLMVVLIPINFGWVSHGLHWYDSPHRIIDGSILLAGGIGFALVQLRNHGDIE